MALGSSYQQQQGNNNTNQSSSLDTNYYSRLRIKNPVDNLGIAFTFWRGTLKVAIIDTTVNPQEKNPDLAYIYLSPTKARLLAECVKRVNKNTESNDVFGVDTGLADNKGLIAIGRETGVPFLFISKNDTANNYKSAQRFNFNVDYNYLVKVHDIETLKFQKEYVNTVELDQLYDVLSDYARFASGAAGASFYDIGRYETAKMTNMIKKIADGGSTNNYNNTNYGGGGRPNNSYNNGNNTQYAHPSPRVNTTQQRSRYQAADIDDLENELG